MFKLLGILVGLYTIHACAKGKIYIKSGPGGRWVYRDESEEYFWVQITIHFGLAVALFTVF